MAYATRKAIVGRGIDTVKSERGEQTSDIDDLDMDDQYDKEMGFGKKKKKRRV